ncbi:MAG TPA: hypothetical protein PLI53_10880 [Geobacteraceae bacterium]|nr:hypothetical protein [Geobacteraceae bacterium]
MIKQLLTFGTVTLLCAALLDPLWASGLGRPIPWFRDIFMGAAGLVCYYLRIKYRKVL